MSSKKRKVRSIVSQADHDELERHYRFLLPDDKEEDDPNNNANHAGQGNNSSNGSTWQDRMVRHYHQHLYKDCVLANLTRIPTHHQLGLRWRTQTEVTSGKGRTSCGNKHCPSHHPAAGGASAADPRDREEALRRYQSQTPSTEADEVQLLDALLPYGALQTDLEVPFRHVERGQTRTELVTLRLCARCAPRLMELSHPSHPALAARRARNGASTDASTSSSSQPNTRTAGAKEPPSQKEPPPPKVAGAGDAESDRFSNSSSSSSTSSLKECDGSGSRRRRDHHRGRRRNPRTRRKKRKRRSN